MSFDAIPISSKKFDKFGMAQHLLMTLKVKDEGKENKKIPTYKTDFFQSIR